MDNHKKKKCITLLLFVIKCFTRIPILLLCTNHGNASMYIWKLFPEHATDDNELHPTSLITSQQKKNENKSIVKRLKIYFEFGPAYNSF